MTLDDALLRVLLAAARQPGLGTVHPARGAHAWRLATLPGQVVILCPAAEAEETAALKVEAFSLAAACAAFAFSLAIAWAANQGSGGADTFHRRVSLEIIGVQRAQALAHLGELGVHRAARHDVHTFDDRQQVGVKRFLGQLGGPLVEHVATDALPGRWLPLPEPLELLRAEGDLLDCDRLALAELVIVYLPLNVVRVHQAALVGAVGTLLEVLEQLVPRLGVLEQVGNREQERLAYRPVGIVYGLHYDVKGSTIILSGARALLAELAVAGGWRGRRRGALPEGQHAHRRVRSAEFRKFRVQS